VEIKHRGGHCAWMSPYGGEEEKVVCLEGGAYD
jgi:hypothetical protein